MSSDTPDEGIPQDPGIPGFDVVSDPRDRPAPDEKDASTEGRERPDDPDREGHRTAPEDG
jgi:hypothetical protein